MDIRLPNLQLYLYLLGCCLPPHLPRPPLNSKIPHSPRTSHRRLPRRRKPPRRQEPPFPAPPSYPNHPGSENVDLVVMAVGAQVPNSALTSFTSIIVASFGFDTLGTQYL